MDNHGIICTLPTTCGTCGTAYGDRWACLQWCSSCGDAICPTCYPVEQREALGQCARCILEKRPTAAYEAGRRAAEEAARRFWETLFAEVIVENQRTCNCAFCTDARRWEQTVMGRKP